MKKISEMNLREVRSTKEYIQQKVLNLEAKIKEIQQDLYDTKGIYNQLVNKENQITSLDKPVIISDHAILRFLERVHDIDIEAIKDDIRLKFESDIKLKELADGSYWNNGICATVRDRTIVTIINREDEDEDKKEKERIKIKVAKRMQREDREGDMYGE